MANKTTTTNTERQVRCNQGYNSESSSAEDKELNYFLGIEQQQQTLSSEIVGAIPNGVGNKQYATHLRVLDSGVFGSLVDKNIIHACPN